MARFNRKPSPGPGLAFSVIADLAPASPVRRPERLTVTAPSLDPLLSDLVTIELVPVDTGIRAVVVGEVDSASAPTLRRELDSALDATPAELVVDLDAVTFLDSAGLSVLATAHRRAVGQQTRLRVLASGRPVIRPMQITGLWDLLGAEQVEPGSGGLA
jgi:anti-sigma B factor antagonist